MTHNTVTNTSGEYLIANLVPGRYSISITAAGFKELQSGEIILTGNQVKRFDGTMDVGTASEVVEVAAAAPTINTVDAQVTGLQSREELTLLPTNQRSTITLFMLNSYNYHAVGSSYSMGGLRGTDTSFTIDGTTSNSNTFGAQSGPQTEVSLESLRDVQFRVSNNSAEFGKVATVIMESRSGENTPHGSLFYSQANGYLNARSFFAATAPPSRPTQHQIAASFGGPIWIPRVYDGHNRTFFYFTFEQNRYPGQSFSSASVPTEAFRNGDFSSLLPRTVINDPLTGQPFGGNKIPAGRISSVAQEFQKVFFLAPNAGSPNNFVNNWGGYLNTSSQVNWYTGRVDHVISSSDNLSVRFVVRNDSYGVPPPDNGQGTTRHSQYRRNINAYISETHIFSPSVVNEFRVGFSRDHSDLKGIHNGNELLRQLGIQGATPNAQTGAPTFYFDNFDNNYEFSDYFWTSQAMEYLDNVTFVKGRHNLKMGANVRRNNPNISNNPDCDFGCYTFDGSMTGFDYADFLLGVPANTRRNFRAPNSYGRWTNMGIYAQDNFKVSQRLTLNFGLRWEYTQPAADKYDLIYTFNPATDGLVVPSDQSLRFISPLYPKNIPIQTAQQANYPRNLVQSNWSNVGPRVGFAFLPSSDNNFVIRGGYGIYYSPLIGSNVGDGIFQGGPYGSSEQFFNQLNNGVPLFQFPLPFGGGPELPEQTVESITKDLRTPYIQQWNLTVEREMPGKVVARATYRGFRANQLVWSRDLNTPPASTNKANETTYFPYPNFFRARWNENGGIQKFNGLDLGVERKFAAGLTFQSQYTLAKNKSDTGDDYERNGVEDPYNRARDYANISFMPRHRWVSNVLYDLPFGRGKRFGTQMGTLANALAGGWTMSAILVEQSGQFLDLQYSGVDILNNRTRSGRPDCVAGASFYPANQSIHNFLNPAAFALPATGTFGNCARNAVNGPSINTLNFSLQKNFRFAEHATLRFMGIATNALNHPIFRNPNTTITSGGFGQITAVLGSAGTNRDTVGAAGSRLVQLGARLDF